MNPTPDGPVLTWQNTVLVFEASGQHAWIDFPLQVEFRCDDTALLIDGYWDGDRRWCVRFAPTHAGTWTWTSRNVDSAMDGLQGTIECVAPGAEVVEANPNLRGFLRVAAGGRYFEYADGTPFLWLGDTLWAVSTLRCGQRER